MIDAIEITNNPVTNWESFGVSLTAHSRRGARFGKWRTEHRRQGGYWAAYLEYYDEPQALREMFNRGLDRQVRFYNEKGAADWEGFVNRMKLTTAGSVETTTLEDVYSECWVRYRDSGGANKRSAVAQDTVALARYGKKQLVINGGEQIAASNADNLAKLVLQKRSTPKSNTETTDGGSLTRLELECLGFIHTLKRQVYNQTASTGAQSADLQLADLIAAGGQFVAATRFQANTLGVTKVWDADRTVFDIAFAIANSGDTLSPPQPWVLYMDLGRVLVYEPQASAVIVNL